MSIILKCFDLVLRIQEVVIMCQWVHWGDVGGLGCCLVVQAKENHLWSGMRAFLCDFSKANMIFPIHFLIISIAALTTLS